LGYLGAFSNVILHLIIGIGTLFLGDTPQCVAEWSKLDTNATQMLFSAFEYLLFKNNIGSRNNSRWFCTSHPGHPASHPEMCDKGV